MQGLWIAASRGMADLADAMNDEALARRRARRRPSARAQSMEQTYWLADRGFYAFATAARRQPRSPSPGRTATTAGPPRRARGAPLVEEDTVLPAVPLWWRALDDRAQ